MIPGKKSSSERFAGADATYSIEAMMGDGKALQAGTVAHPGMPRISRRQFENGIISIRAARCKHLLDNFVGAVDSDSSAQSSWCMATIRDLSCRLGLRPIRLSSCRFSRLMKRKRWFLEAAKKIREQLVKADVRVKVDEREGQSPGFKFNDWEMRGVPLRVEIGPKDVAKGSVVLARRDKPGREGKTFVSQEGIAESVQQLLVEIQKALFDRALAFREAHGRA